MSFLPYFMFALYIMVVFGTLALWKIYQWGQTKPSPQPQQMVINPVNHMIPLDTAQTIDWIEPNKSGGVKYAKVNGKIAVDWGNGMVSYGLADTELISKTYETAEQARQVAESFLRGG